jgi:molybdopterin-containing oxidoreductase family membrane subunit
VLIIVGVWIEKGMGLVVPAFIPTPIGEIYEYTPSLTEIMVSIGIWAIGLLIFTLLAKAALPVQCEFLRKQRAREREQSTWDGFERRHNPE